VVKEDRKIKVIVQTLDSPQKLVSVLLQEDSYGVIIKCRLSGEERAQSVLKLCNNGRVIGYDGCENLGFDVNSNGRIQISDFVELTKRLTSEEDE